MAVSASAPTTAVPKATPQATLPFGNGRLEIRSFLLERPQGNLLIYGSPTIDPGALPVDGRAPIIRHYLGHHHEAMFMPSPPDALGVPIVVGEGDRELAQREIEAPVHGFGLRHRIDEDFAVIPIPGHTAGSAAYLWEAGGNRYLFTSDSLFVRGGRWAGAMLESSDRNAYVASLELLATLEFDALVPWLAEAGAPVIEHVAPVEARRRIEAVAADVRAGGSG